MLGLGTPIVTSGSVAKSALLDDFDDSVAAYSVRNLNSSYSGPCMRVRRASDNAESDIYFTSGGDLDTVALESFCSGTDGFVVRWYNQAFTHEAQDTKLLNQSYVSNPEIAYSLRQLDSTYTGDAIAVTGTSGMVGVKHIVSSASGYSAGFKRSGTAYSSSETSSLSLEVFIATPGKTDTSKIIVRHGYTTSSNQGTTANKNVSPGVWTRIDVAEATLDSDQVEVYTNYAPPAGSFILVRNVVNTGAASFNAYPTTASGITSLSPSDVSAGNTEVRGSYDVGFNGDGNLDEEKLLPMAFASPPECFEIRVNDFGDGTTNTSGNYYISIPVASTLTAGADTAGDYTVTLEMYADCPSVTGDVAIKGQIGPSVRTFAEGNTLPQKQWVTRTMTLGSVDTTNVVGRLYFAGDSQVTQELEFGDVIYFRRVTLNHANDTDYNAEFEFSSSANGFVKGGVGQNEYDVAVGKAPFEELGVEKWYDQSGNANKAEQSTFANMPRIFAYNSTSKHYGTTKESGAATLQFAQGTGTARSLVTSGNVDLQEYQCWSMVTKFQDDAATRDAFWWQSASGSNTAYFGQLNATDNIYYGGNVDVNEFITSADRGLTDDTLDSIIFYKSGSNVFLQVQSENQASISIDDGTEQMKIDSTRAIRIGANSGGGQPFTGTMSEIVLLNADMGSHISSLEENLNQHYRVRDRHDVFQEVLASQPKIYDSSSGVETLSGKPSLKFDGTDDILKSVSAAINTEAMIAVASTDDETTSAQHIVRQGSAFIRFDGDNQVEYRNTTELRDNASNNTPALANATAALVSWYTQGTDFNDTNASWRFYFNGSLLGTKTGNNGSSESGTFRIGAQQSTQEQLDGNVSEAIVIDKRDAHYDEADNIHIEINDYYSIF